MEPAFVASPAVAQVAAWRQQPGAGQQWASTPSLWSDSKRLALLLTLPAAGLRRRVRLNAAESAVAIDAQEKAPKGRVKRLGRSTGALRKWGGVGFKVRQDGMAHRPRKNDLVKSKDWRIKWTPKRETWEAWVTDDEDSSAFGELAVGHEVEVLASPKRGAPEEWVSAVTVGFGSTEDQKQARLTLSTGGSQTVDLGKGRLRRDEDARELCSESDLARMAKLRTLKKHKDLKTFGLRLTSVAARTHAIYNLVRMGKVGVRMGEEMMEELQPYDVASTAIRELCHAHARNGDLEAALRYVDLFDEVHSAQLLVEVLALGLTGIILEERQKLGGPDFLSGIETNPVVLDAVRWVVETIPKLDSRAKAVREMAFKQRERSFTEAFNELLLSCGRAHAVKVSFRVLEWMEALTVPKDSFTYEAIGVNVVKRISKLQKVWDLPQAPEDEVCPEVVFAGRSNVGKSSLVNMMLNRNALAPTSSRPGRTKTMDFFDVNNGHPALPRFRLVDVPGLGFARVSHELRERWISLIGGYFVQRKSLKLVFHLLDAGLCELMPADRELWRLLAQARRSDYELCIVLTKADNSVPSQLERFASLVREALRREGSDLALRATIFACSSMTKLGKDTLWRKIWSAVGGEASTIADLGAGPDNAERYRKTEFGLEEKQ